jgi:hypothetical protein
MSKPLWFAGDCDRILAELKKWYAQYYHPTHPVVREEISVIDFSAAFDPEAGIIESGKRRIPTVVRVHIRLKDKDLNYMLNIISELRPAGDTKYKRLAEMLEKTRPIMKNSPMLGGGWYWTPMDFRRSDVKDLIDIMEEARTGKKPLTIEETIAKQPKGKGLWQS